MSAIHYTVETDSYGDVTLWRFDGEDDPRPMPLLTEASTHPDVWRAAVTYLKAVNVDPVEVTA